jgi:hypothetical protein
MTTSIHDILHSPAKPAKREANQKAQARLIVLCVTFGVRVKATGTAAQFY